MSALSVWWNRFETAVVAVLAVVALAIVCIEIVVRYFAPRYLTDWGQDFVIFFIIWAVFLSGSALVRDRRHIRADIVIRRFSVPVQRGLEIFNALMGLAFCTAITWYGYEVVEFAHRLDERTESSLLFPMWIYYAGLPAGMALMSVRYLRLLYAYIFAFDADTMVIREGERELHSQEPGTE